MVPAGYLLKRIQKPPEWLKAPHVAEVCNVSGCFTDDAVDILTPWLHNAFGVANDPELLWRLAREGSIDVSDAQLFYYEAYEQEIESETWRENPPPWRPLKPLPSAMMKPVLAAVPDNTTRLGYDVVVCEDFLEHSPLLCNSVAATLPVNAHCLCDTLEQAKGAIEGGQFDGCEPGDYRIYSVYRVEPGPVTD